MPTFLPSHLLALPPSCSSTFLLSYFSKYLCLFVFISGFPYPLFSFLQLGTGKVNMNQGVNNQMNQEKNKLKVLVIHGPNLNMLGKREPEIYGKTTLDEINSDLENLGTKLGIFVETFQSNHEGAIVEKIQEAATTQKGIIINPAAYTHTSIAIRDALLALDVPIIEIHISNIYKREPFRHKSLISDVVTAQITGLGIKGYSMALKALAEMIQNR
jgi:3-dehydroquinate dehydratase-2